MKAAVLRGPRALQVETAPDPKAGPGDVIVEIAYCGICGSDVHAYASGALFPAGTVMGHEATGTVVEVGRDVEAYRPGDRVVIFGSTPCGACPACRRGEAHYCLNGLERTMGCSLDVPGAFAETVWLPQPEETLLPLPAGLSLQAGTLTDPVATALRAVRGSRVRPGDMVMVLGAGPIGLMAVQLLKLGGASRLIVSEPSSPRAELARRLGADVVLNPLGDEPMAGRVLELTGGLGPDIVYECSGTPAAFRQSIELVRPGGQVLAVGVIEGETAVEPLEIVFKEIDLRGSFAFSRYEFELALRMLARGSIQTEPLISDVIALDDIRERGFERLLSTPRVVKILVQPGIEKAR
jgi:(R,R)-butanediol dehydrogenase/meso-butanediol dehydrogenase/diacetyl reductase